jgi:hypothetical protein
MRLGEKHKRVTKIATQKRQIGGIPMTEYVLGLGNICIGEDSLRIAEAGRDLDKAAGVLGR